MPRTKTNSSETTVPYIDSPGQLAEVARELAQAPTIAFDTEFLWERTYAPRLGLIQIADSERAWLVDPLELSPKAMKPLLDLLASPRILKVAHAVDQDQICLFETYKVVADPVFDTSIGASLCGLGEQVGLSTLLHKLLHVEVGKGHSRTNWLKRPLPASMLKYAAADVTHLIEAAEILIERLAKSGREEWARSLSARAGDIAKAHFDANALAAKLANGRRLDPTSFSALQELIKWREQEARRLDIPRRWLAEDKVLLKLAQARPASAKELEDFRGLGISKRPRSVDRVLDAIQRGIKSPRADYVRPDRKRGPTPRESAALIVLRCFLNALAADHGVPLRMLIASDAMLDLLRGKFEDVDSLAASKILEPRALALVGDDLIDILNGRKSLRLVNGVAKQTDE